MIGIPAKMSTALALAAICVAARHQLAAQTTGQVPRIIEPQLTRLFGSDSLEMSWPAMSPDGRWIVFGTYEAQKGSLWAVSVAGGEPIPLTTGAYTDFNPAFLPGGDRITFQSNRPSRSGDWQSYVVVMPFDPRTGRGGTPRQVSLEGTHGQALAVSPDGEWIAYATRADTLSRLMAVPSTGGTARVLAEFGNSVLWIQNAVWSGDGRYVYFGLRRRGTERRSVMRAPLEHGSAQELGAAVRLLRVFPDRGWILQQIQGQGPGQVPTYEIATPEGRPVARFSTPRNTALGRLTPDGRGFLASQSNRVAPIRVVPVAGGAARQLTEAREYDWPLGWSEDGSHVYVSTRINGQEEVIRLPVNGGPAAQWPIPKEANRPATIGPDGRYLAYTVSSRSDTRTLAIRRLDDGETRVVTRTAFYAPLNHATGPGGTETNGDEFFYVERRGDRLELRSTPPEGPSRLLRAFPASYVGRTGFGVHGNRVAYTETRGDSTVVFIAEGPTGRARQVTTVAGLAPQPVWSHDARWLAFDHYPPNQGARHDILLIGVGADGALTQPPRLLESGLQAGWQVEWLPDDRAVIAFGMTGVANETHAFLVTLRDGARPISITRDDPAIRWGYSLSPDGRYLAYPAEIPRGSSLWRIDFGDLLTGRQGMSR